MEIKFYTLKFNGDSYEPNEELVANVDLSENKRNNKFNVSDYYFDSLKLLLESYTRDNNEKIDKLFEKIDEIKDLINSGKEENQYTIFSCRVQLHII